MPQTLPNDLLSMQLSHFPPLQLLDTPAYFTITPMHGFFLLQAYQKNNFWTEKKALLPEQMFGFLLLRTPIALCPRWLNTEKDSSKSCIWIYEHTIYKEKLTTEEL